MSRCQIAEGLELALEESRSWRRAWVLMEHGRTEAASPARQAAAVGIGLYIGCTPFYGFHLLLSLGAPLPRCDVALLFDVVHLMQAGEQDVLLARIGEAMGPGGLLILREVDAAGGWRFRAVRLGNWLCRAVQGQWRRRFHFRTASEWSRRLTELGFTVEAQSMRGRMPFANVVLYARRGTAVASP